MSRVRDEFRQFRELSRLFFGRFLDNDLICLDGDVRAAFGGIMALLIAPGLFVPFFEFMRFSSVPFCFQPWFTRDIASIPDKALHLGLSMSVLGIAMVLEWDAVLPDRRDCAVLRPLPVRLSTLFAAKISALVRFSVVITAAVGAIPAVFFPMAVLGNAPLDLFGWYIRAHFISLLAGNAFICVAMVAIQGVLINLLGWRRFQKFAPYAQYFLISSMLVMFFFSIGVSIGMDPRKPVTVLLLATPPLWFVGLYESLLGWTLPVFQDLEKQALSALGIAGSVAAISYVLSYRFTVEKSFDEPGSAIGRPGRFFAVVEYLCNRVLLRTPAERASFHFVWLTLKRSRSHRVLVASCAAAGLALVFQSVAGLIASGNRTWWQSPHSALLPAPLILTLFLLIGLRYSFTIPAELRANWLFQVAGNGDPKKYVAGVRKAVVMLGVISPFALLLPIHMAMWGWFTGCLHILCSAIVAYLTMDVLLLGFEKLPFTCSYVAGKANLKATWSIYVLGYIALVSGFTAIDYWILREPTLFFVFLAFVALIKTGIEYYRCHVLDGDFSLVFDDRPAPDVQTLELMQ